MLSTRILTAAILIPLVLAALFLLSPRNWALVTLAVVLIGALEWSALGGYGIAARALFVGVVLLSAGVLLFAPASGFAQGWPGPVVLGVCGVGTLFWIVVVPPWLKHRWHAPSVLVSAIVGWLVLLAAWVALVQLQAQSPWRVLAAMAVVWIADTAAYFVGRSFGRHKLAPEISPGKTWEGVAGGLAAVAIYAVAVLIFSDTGRQAGAANMVSWVVLVVAVAALSVCGDLFESLLKRQRGVKDSGHLLPGHGGVLDRVDALLAAMPPLALAAVVLLR